MRAHWSRRQALSAGLLVPAAAGWLDAGPVRAQGPVEFGTAQPFSFERLIVQAREMAQRPFEPRPSVPPWLADLPLQQLRNIGYRAERAVPVGDGPYRLQLFHLGAFHRFPVRVHLVEEGQAREILYSPDLFDFGSVRLAETLPREAGFAGFSVHHTFTPDGPPVELLTFLGASYFRAVGRGTRLGISARGLALETGLGRPEEFPAFTHFWVVRPNDPRDPLQICALLDSQSVAGAYRFDVAPREGTIIGVDASLFFRADVTQVGIAPLTSMYFFAPNDRLGIDDHRLQVHDSDGLSIWRGPGEVLWRPLVNPRELRISVFGEENPRGFGLLQREREFLAYGDLDARYDRRPNLWVEPKGAWSKGSVRLIEIPILSDTHDNIVTFWTPEAPVRAGNELRVAYSLLWSLQPPIETGLMRVTATRIGRGGQPGSDDPLRRVLVEFAPPPNSPPVPDPPEVVVQCGGAECLLASLRRNEFSNGWQATFDVRPGNGAVELRCYLTQGGRPVSETWLYRLDNS